MMNITENTKVIAFNKEEKQYDDGLRINVSICSKDVHLKLTSFNGMYPESKLLVVEACDGSCQKAYHKTDSTFALLKEMRVEELESQIRIVSDLPKLIAKFLEKGIIGESSKVDVGKGYIIQDGWGAGDWYQEHEYLVTRP